MTDLQNKNQPPTLEEIAEVIQNPVFLLFCSEIRDTYKCRETIEFSSCSLEPGWNVKFKKAGKTLCTIYPKETYFTVMVVVGRKEKEPVEAILGECTPQLREIYARTREGNGQRWLMIDLEERGDVYRDIVRLIQIRRGIAACSEKHRRTEGGETEMPVIKAGLPGFPKA
ncbi:MAG: DUF3788 domain-containing protein [Lachnospiraceae bacterium]|jgi:hypothetical protein|nr:DUF3788 domain-containing protein [Lachnospiraceae bacterium]